MKNKIRVKEFLFVIPIGIVLNIILIKYLNINNLFVQGLTVAMIFTVLTIIYKKFVYSCK